MKTLYFFFVCLWSTISFSQEFKTYDNGLIYSPYAMEQLKILVGDKNEEFRVCELNKKYASIEQTKGRIFILNKPNIKILKKELMNEITFEEFVKKYGELEENQLYLLTKRHYTNYDGQKVVGINEQPDGSQVELLESVWKDSTSKCWIWNFSNKDYVDVVYIEKEFSSSIVPDRYARMVQYSECLIDTTSQIFNEEASKKRWFLYKEGLKFKQNRFIEYIQKQYGKKKPLTYPKENWSRKQMLANIDSLKQWEKSKKEFVDQVLSKDNKFHELLNEAYSEALTNKNSNDEFEQYVTIFLTPEKALNLKRNRIVTGQCSMDNSPRIHAMNIAQLAGESLNWDIFLRAHLNVLNDYMNRVSDGSWAWDARRTYIKELEELNINIPDLVFGIAFRSKNVSKGHYFGNIGRLGRAISESKDIEIFKKELPLIMMDEKLDDYNRLLMFYLYDNMCYYSDTSENKVNYSKNRNKAIGLLPSYLKKSVTK